MIAESPVSLQKVLLILGKNFRKIAINLPRSALQPGKEEIKCEGSIPHLHNTTTS